MTFWKKNNLRGLKYVVHTKITIDLLPCAKNWKFKILFNGPNGSAYAKVENGVMEVDKGFPWNGADHLYKIWDPPNTQEATLVHDVLCMAMNPKTHHFTVSPHSSPSGSSLDWKCADDHLYCLLVKHGRTIRKRTWHTAVRSYRIARNRLGGGWLSETVSAIIGIGGGIFGLVKPKGKFPSCP